MSFLWSFLGSFWDALPSWRAPSHHDNKLPTDAVPGSKRRRTEDCQQLFSTDMIEIGTPRASASKRLRALVPSKPKGVARPPVRTAL